MIRRAAPGDVDFLVDLLGNADVAPYLAARRAHDRDEVLAEVERSQREPAEFGVFVIEVDGRRAGTMAFEVVNRRSRIAHLGGLAVHPDFRGRHLADEASRLFQRYLLLDLGFHRLELEVYGFNARATAHAERAGFVREGTKRRAYRRHGGWADGVLYGLTREDLGLPPAVDLLYEYVARHNAGVRTGNWEALGECFAEGAVLAFEGVPLGPFAGRVAIVAAYADRPPDDDVRIFDPVEDGGVAVARYTWAAAPERPAGSLRLAPAEGLIDRLVVTVEG